MEKAKSHWSSKSLVFPVSARGAKVKAMFTILLPNCRNEA
jgi:hypothetical protein